MGTTEFCKGFLLFATLAFVQISWSQNGVRDEVKWDQFISSHDLVFDTMSTKWEEAPYFANGFIGSMIYGDTLAKNRVKIQVFRTDVHDHRGDSAGWTAYSRPRLPIGYFSLSFKGEILESHLRQELYTADLTGTIKTSEGTIKLHHYVAALEDLIFTEIECTGNEEYDLEWHSAEAKSTRTRFFPDTESVIPKYAEAYGKKYTTTLKVYEPNPQPVLQKKGAISLSLQNLLAGGQYAVGWKRDELEKGKSLLTFTIQNTYPDQTAGDKAITLLSKSDPDRYRQLYKSHKSWWADYYQKSFISIPDKELEGFYWIQMYKIGSSNRPDGAMMDTSGPWFQPTPWPYITWDLNVQLCYWPLNVSNHLDLAMSLPNTLNNNKSQLIKNVRPAEWQTDAAYMALATAQDLKGSPDDDKRYSNLNANLPWAMHNVWLMYRFSMDKGFLKEKVYPLLKRSMNYYLHLLKKEADGNYHIPIGYSPEYPVKAFAQTGETKDPNIDLALIRWGLSALMEASKTLNIDVEKRLKWTETLTHLSDYPIDKNGFMIGDDLPYTVSHRHYSHLLMIYPLYLINIEDNQNRDLIEKSLTHWIGDPNGLQGYSYTGASSISAAVGNGNDALNYLKGLNRFLLPNGLYKEAGPVFETPLSGAKSIQDMLLQSWGNTIRVFPALPDAWKDVVFHKWLAQGAFAISASLKNGQTDFIVIKSLAGEPCTFVSSINNPIGKIDGKEVNLNPIAKSTYRVDLQKGQTLIVKKKEYSGTFKIDVVAEN